MTENAAIQVNDYIVKAGEMGLESSMDLLDMGGIYRSAASLISHADELTAAGEHTGGTTSAREVVLGLADQIEHGGIAEDARKPVADIMRFLAQSLSTRQIPTSR
ncbi:hypothetical protein HFO32_22295 [Rhizobium leguminosarum]|uniref:hypothetical protein n=1 Tax=Rhizobium leguminosarum TaxID=384 RepID=UPI001C963ADC|nr:hypothetical protein [Rhizobium leguminosarum]MBY5684857.1 hypothetical protein [Rhizobium leguminosarum]